MIVKKQNTKYEIIYEPMHNKSWRRHPTKQQLYGHLPRITKTIKVRWTRQAGHCWRSRDKQKQGDQLEPTYSSSVGIRDVVLRTCQKRWTIGRSGKRRSGISMLVVWQDDGDDDKGVLKALSLSLYGKYLSFAIPPCRKILKTICSVRTELMCVCVCECVHVYVCVY